MKRITILLVLLLATSAPAWSDTPATERQAPAAAAAEKTQSSVAPNYNLNWYSINSGGGVNVASANYHLGLSAGQAVAGAASGTNYNMGVGFWYLFGGAQAACPVAMTGDVDMTGTITSSDIIYSVNFVFKGGLVPVPCQAAGDVNCDGVVTASDIIYLVNYVFKGGAQPCDVCTMIPGTWTCP